MTRHGPKMRHYTEAMARFCLDYYADEIPEAIQRDEHYQDELVDLRTEFLAATSDRWIEWRDKARERYA